MAWEVGNCGDWEFNGIEIDIEAWEGTHLAMQRNRAIEYSIRKGYDVIVMVDSDQVPKNGCLLEGLKTIRRYPNPVVTCPTVTSNGRVLVWQYPGKPVQHDYETYAEYQSTGMIYRGSGGFIMAETKQFRRLEVPWFCDEFTDDAMIHRSRSQDVWFYDQCRAADMEILCLWSFWLEHIKPIPILDKMTSGSTMRSSGPSHPNEPPETAGRHE